MNYVVIGLYFYSNRAVDVAKNIKPSGRRELEITTVNKGFLKDSELKVQIWGCGFAWLDTGTHEDVFMRQKVNYLLQFVPKKVSLLI